MNDTYVTNINDTYVTKYLFRSLVENTQYRFGCTPNNGIPSATNLALTHENIPQS